MNNVHFTDILNLSHLHRELSDTIMNVVGAFMWVSVGATALHYWQGYMADHDQLVVVHERTVSRRMHRFSTISEKKNIENIIKCYISTKFTGWFSAWIAVCFVWSFVRGRHRSGIHPFCKVNDTF